MKQRRLNIGKCHFLEVSQLLLSPIVSSVFEQLQANLPQTGKYNQVVETRILYTIEIGSIELI